MICWEQFNSAGDGDVECRRWLQALRWRWGKWARSETMENMVSVKNITMTTLTKEARGPFVYSMLEGDALTAVEHLELP